MLLVACVFAVAASAAAQPVEDEPVAPGPTPAPAPAVVVECPAPGPPPAKATYSQKLPTGSPDCLPPYYRGQNPTQVFTSYTAPVKGEFETTEEYQQRIASLGLTSGFALQLARDALNSFAGDRWQLIDPRYDADTQVFTVEVTHPVPHSGIEGLHIDKSRIVQPSVITTSLVWSLKDRRRVLGRYTGQTKMGVKGAVQRLAVDEWLLLTDAPPSTSGAELVRRMGAARGDGNEIRRIAAEIAKHDAERGKLFRLPVERSQARRFKENLAFLVVGTPAMDDAGRVAKTVVEHIGPSLDRPYDVERTTHYFWASTLSLWAYDYPSGRVWKRWDLFTSDGTGDLQAEPSPMGAGN